MSRLTATLTLCAFLLCNAPAHVGAPVQTPSAVVPEGYAAIVKEGEARFTLPVPQRPEWRWRRNETKENAREYAFDVRVVNEGREYAFGLYLWRFPGATPGRGSFSSLIDAGQKSLFERVSNGHMVKVPDIPVKVKRDGERLVIIVSGRKNVARLFSGRPAEVKVTTLILDEPPVTQTVPVNYEN